MQAVILLFVTAVGAPWSLPENDAADSAPSTRAEQHDSAALAEYQTWLEQSERQRPAPAAQIPAARTAVSPARHAQNPYRNRGDVQQAGFDQQLDANDNVRLAQVDTQNTWPATRANRGAGRASASVQPPARPNLFGDSADLDGDPYQRGTATFQMPEFGDQTDTNTAADRYRQGRLETNFAPEGRQPQPPARTNQPSAVSSFPDPNVPDFDTQPATQYGRSRDAFRQAQLELPRGNGTYQPNPSEAPIDPYSGRTGQIDSRVALDAAPQMTLPDFGVDAQSPTAASQQPPAPGLTLPTLSDQQKEFLNKPVAAVGQAAGRISETTQGNSGLLMLAFFASIGLNFYLGWIAWDTYNRYQDMVSDLRYSGASGRRDRGERDPVDRRSDRRLVESGTY